MMLIIGPSMESIYLESLAILALVLANGFFAASEFALIASRKSRLKNWARQGNKAAERTFSLLKQSDRFLAAVQVGITFVATMAGVFGGATIVQSITPLVQDIQVPFIQASAETISIFAVVIGITFLSVVVGELIPKYIALSNPEKIAVAVTGPIRFFTLLTFFLVSFLTFSARTILRLFGLGKVRERLHITEDEINILVAEGTEKGVFDKTEQQLIKSVFDFSDTTVRKAMTPRVDIIAIGVDDPLEKITELMSRTGFSRYPVYKENIDQILGILYTKDLIRLRNNDTVLILKDLLRKPLFVPDSMPLSVVLTKFQKRKVHIAVVLDEFGGTAGVITLEDVLEEIVGEIQDEHDYTQSEFVAHSDKIAFASGALRPDELNDKFGTSLPEEVSETLAGLIIETCGHIPEAAEEVQVLGVKFTILEKEGNRIKRVQVEKP